MVELSFTFPGDEFEQFRIGLVRLGLDMRKPFKPVATEIKDWFDDAAGEHYRSKGSRGPRGAWKRWAPSTAARKKPGDELMVETGRLKGALSDSGSAYALRNIRDSRAVLGVSFSKLGAIYPVYHQAGSPDTNLPRRAVVDMTKDDAINLAKIVQSSLIRRARKAGIVDGRKSSGVSRAF